MESFSVKAILTAVDAGFKSVMTQASAEAQKMTDLVTRNSKVMGTSLLGVGGAMTAMGVSSAKGFGEFQQSLNKAAVIAGGTSKDIKELSDLANRMGAELPLSAKDAADAMVSMARDGASIKQIKNEFPAIAQAATAAGADLQTTGSVVQQAMNIWGKSLESPTQAAAILTQTANLSNASIEDMQQALATIGATANSMGMDLGTTSEAIGLLTNKGFSAAQASMDLNHALLQMQAPSKVAQKEMDELGLSFVDSEGKMKSFPKILSEISRALDGMTSAEKTKALKRMFGTAGMQAIAPLLDSIKDKTDKTSTSWKAYSKALNEAAGTTTAAEKTLSEQANDMQQNLGSKIEQVGGNWEALRNKAMESTGGISGALLDLLNNTMSWATQSNSAIAQLIRGFVGLSPVIGPVLLALGGLLVLLPQIKAGIDIVRGAFESLKIISGLKSAISGLFGFLTAGPWGLIIAGVAAVVGALTWFFTQTEIGKKIWSDFCQTATDAWNSLYPIIQPAIAGIVQAFQGLGNALSSVWQSVGPAFSQLGQQIGNLFSTLEPLLQPLITLLAVPLVGALASVAAVLTVVVYAFSLLVQTVSAVLQAVMPLITMLVQIVLLGASMIVSGLQAAWSAIVPAAMAAFNTLADFFGGIWRVIQGIFQVAAGLLSGNMSMAWNGIKNIVVGAWRAVTAPLRAVWDTVKGLFNAGVAFIKAVVHVDLSPQGRAIMESFYQGLLSVWGKIKGFISKIAGWIDAHKGPISYDKRLLIDNGQAIMSGLNRGLSTGFGDVQGTVNSMADRIKGLMDINATPNITGLKRLATIGQSSFDANYSGSMTVDGSTIGQENNRLLREIANKDSAIYLDGDALVGGTYERYDAQLGQSYDLQGRFS